MIPSKAEISVTSTMEGEEIQMGIDHSSIAFIQKILTDLYSDPELAVIREYSTNARDSHLEAGHNKAIEVTTPTSFDPSLHIKDYGIGLSLEDIKKVYSLYGASTKRSNAAANGMLGLGCKSALTYTNQFTIRSVKDGMLVIVMVTRDESGVGSMKVLHNGSTNEPNGVEIVVPSKYGHNFERKAKEFFSYWEYSPIPVLLNGKTPDFINPLLVNNNIGLIEHEGYGNRQHAKVHMAGVTYNADTGVDWSKMNLSWGTSVIFFVDDGAVDFTPSREELHYTARTKKEIERLVEELRSGLIAGMQKEIDAQPTHKDAIAVYKRWVGRFSRNPTFNYKGQSPQGYVKINETYIISRYGNNNYSDYNASPPLASFIFQEIPEARVIVVGKQGIKITTNQRAKLRTWATNNSYDSGIQFLFMEKDDHAPWTDDIAHVDWQEILNVKPLPNANKNYTAPQHYVYVSNRPKDSIDPITEVDKSKPIAYAYLSDVKPSDEPLVGNWADQAGINIYGVPKAKLKEFQKNYPTAKYYKDALIDAVKVKFDAFTQAEQDLIRNYNSIHQLPHVFKQFPPNLIDKFEDPELRAAITISRNRSTIHEENLDLFTRYKKWQQLRDRIRISGRIVCMDNILHTPNPEYAKMGEKYPLIFNSASFAQSLITEHIIIYCNAVYQRSLNAVQPD